MFCRNLLKKSIQNIDKFSWGIRYKREMSIQKSLIYWGKGKQLQNQMVKEKARREAKTNLPKDFIRSTDEE